VGVLGPAGRRENLPGACLRSARDDRFAAAGSAFDDRQITVTVPASFDAAAQKLTITAAEDAAFPPGVRLPEEPRAAFCCRLERHGPAQDIWKRPAETEPGPRHVVVVDILNLRQDLIQARAPGLRRGRLLRLTGKRSDRQRSGCSSSRS
jgi:hypothetical protein